MTTFLVALTISFALNVMVGSIVFLLWNYGPATFLPLPEIGWLAGVVSFLLIRLIVSPPTFEIDLKQGL